MQHLGPPTDVLLGALARCAWSGLVISGQFAIYDVLKSLFAVAGPDLTLHLDLAL